MNLFPRRLFQSEQNPFFEYRHLGFADDDTFGNRETQVDRQPATKPEIHIPDRLAGNNKLPVSPKKSCASNCLLSVSSERSTPALQAKRPKTQVNHPTLPTNAHFAFSGDRWQRVGKRHQAACVFCGNRTILYKRLDKLSSLCAPHRMWALQKMQMIFPFHLHGLQTSFASFLQTMHLLRSAFPPFFIQGRPTTTATGFTHRYRYKKNVSSTPHEGSDETFAQSPTSCWQPF